MNKKFWLFAVLIELMGCSASQADTLGFVASYGSDSNACSRSAPCRSLLVAVTKTFQGGVIICLDAGPYQVTNIAKSITIDCRATGAVVNSGYELIIVDGANISVKLIGLVFNGAIGISAGIDFVNGAALIVEDCQFAIFNSGGDSTALLFRPSNPGAKLIVSNSSFESNGFNNAGGGIVVRPQPGGTAQVTLDRVTVSKNVFGVAFDGSQSTGGINGTIKNSVLTSNANDGVVATSQNGSAPVGVAVIDSQSTNNGFGVRSIGSNVTVRVERSTIIGNGTGLSGGGALLSAGNNVVQANATNGSFTGAFALQ